MPAQPHATREGTLSWVPRCTQCGAEFDDPVVEGDERRPRRDEELMGQARACPDCGTYVPIGPRTIWVRRDVGRRERALQASTRDDEPGEA